MNARELLQVPQTGLRIAVFGEWGESNLGDWAIHEGVMKYLSPLTRRVDCYQCGALRPFDIASDAIGVNGGGAARPVDTPALSVLNSWPGLKRSMRGLRQEVLMRRLMPRLAEADLICVGGGALLTDTNLHFPQSLIIIAAAAAKLRKPLWCLGCGVDGGWSAKGRRLLLDFLDCCDIIAVRDNTTAAMVSDLTGRRIPVFGDFAFSATIRPDPLPPGTGQYLLAINIAHLTPPWAEYQQAYEDTLIQAVRRYVRRGISSSRIVVFTTGTPQDDEPALRFRQRLSAAVELRKPQDLGELRRLLHDSEIVLATRLHAAILSLSEGRPVIGVSPTPKISNFFETIGLASYSLRIPEAKTSDLTQMLGNSAALARQRQLIEYGECRATRRIVASVLQHQGQRALRVS